MLAVGMLHISPWNTQQLPLLCAYLIGGDRMGRTNVVIDDDLVKECQKLTGIRKRRALIDYALHEVRRRGRQKRLLELKGTIKWDGKLTEWRKARI